MEEFALCIEYILLNRDRLCVPGLGTFVVRQIGANYDMKEELFLPPVRIVQYDNQMAKGEEAFFTSAIRQIYSISAQEAQSKLDVWIADFYQSIEDTGTVDLGCVGTFTGHGSGHLLFTPSESGIASPAFYALDTFHIKRLNPMESKKKAEKVISNTNNTLVIRLPHRIMRYVAAVSAAALVLFGLSTPVDDARLQPTQQQSMVLAPTALNEVAAPVSKESTVETPAAAEPEAQKPEDTAGKTEEATDKEAVAVDEAVQASPAQPAPEEVIGQADAPTAILLTNEAAPAPKVQKEECYYIVLASNVSNKNAENYVEVLKKRGIVSARVLKGKFNRVVVGEYATAEEARAAVSDIKQRDKEYQGAWIYKQGNE